MIARYLAVPALLLVLVAGCDTPAPTTTPPAPSTPPSGRRECRGHQEEEGIDAFYSPTRSPAAWPLEPLMAQRADAGPGEPFPGSSIQNGGFASVLTKFEVRGWSNRDQPRSLMEQRLASPLGSRPPYIPRLRNSRLRNPQEKSRVRTLGSGVWRWAIPRSSLVRSNCTFIDPQIVPVASDHVLGKDRSAESSGSEAGLFPILPGSIEPAHQTRSVLAVQAFIGYGTILSRARDSTSSRDSAMARHSSSALAVQVASGRPGPPS